MNSIFKKHEWIRMLLGILLLVAGVITIVLAIVNRSGVSITLNITIAIMLFVIGGVMCIVSLLNDTKVIMTLTLVMGAFLIALGVAVIIVQDFVSTLLVILLAAFLISMGGISIFKGVTLIIFRAKWFWYVALFIVGTIGITLGILSLCYRDIAFIVTFIVVGAALVIMGVITIVISSIHVKKIKDDKSYPKVIEQK